MLGMVNINYFCRTLRRHINVHVIYYTFMVKYKYVLSKKKCTLDAIRRLNTYVKHSITIIIILFKFDVLLLKTNRSV